MKYRKFVNIGVEVSALGFGAMRLPVINGVMADVDEPAAVEMMSYAFDHGVNYVDTAYPYHDGNSEVVVGKALNNGYRDKVYVADKLPTWMIEKPDDPERYFNEQLKRLGVDYIDFYLLHNLHSGIWETMKSFKVLEWALEKVTQGKIKYLGFSIHDSTSVFKPILDYFDWDFTQIQYNYLHEQVQVGTEGLLYAGEARVPVIIMEPLLGGALTHFPDDIMKKWNEAGRNPVDMALQWLWNKPQISLVLSGMSSMEQVRQNIEYASKSGAGTLTKEDLNLISSVRDAYKKLVPIPCTSCKYCIPCPRGIDIPYLFSLYNESCFYMEKESINKIFYNVTLQESAKADKCVNCGKCMKKCPQRINIPENLKKVHEKLVDR